MAKLKLYTENFIQGKFNPGRLNLLFTFQVNCPGCFSYGFPLIALLNDKYGESLSCIGLSTAFEDYEFNSADNTKILVQNGVLVGETQKMFGDKLPYPIKIPIAMDKTADSKFDFETLAKEMCNANPDFSNWSDSYKEEMHLRVKRFLISQDRISLTFSVNLFQGTPTFVLFDNDYEILDSWFGHIPREQIQHRIEKHL